ncbi:MAG: MarR family winged helix-turn-helix transcriptional regulator [Bacteroidota bacterium]|jgi:DNA-binding MarR family transcriptional regulator
MELSYWKTGVDLLRQTLRCREIDKHLSDKTELTVDEMHCLGVLFLERPSCVKNLSEFLGLSPTRTSKILLSLERRGSVTRTHDSADHRKEQISLTDEGKTVAEKILSLYTEIGNALSLYGDSALRFAWQLWNTSHANNRVEGE